MEQRAKSLEGELQASSQKVDELRTKLADVRKESLTDPLTNIANRKAFDDAAAAGAQAALGGEAVSLLICDIDHFKKFNDNWGHQTATRCCALVAACLSETSRAATPRRAMAARNSRCCCAQRPGRRGPCRRADPPDGRDQEAHKEVHR